MAILQTEHDPYGACKRLFAEANGDGRRDNITSIVARFDEAKADE